MTLADLDALIQRTERAAIGKAMCGQWAAADDVHLAALYDERCRERTNMTDRQLDGFACVRCGAEPDAMRPVGFGPRGQLFECADGHASDAVPSDDWSNEDE